MLCNNKKKYIVHILYIHYYVDEKHKDKEIRKCHLVWKINKKYQDELVNETVKKSLVQDTETFSFKCFL